MKIGINYMKIGINYMKNFMKITVNTKTTHINDEKNISYHIVFKLYEK